MFRLKRSIFTKCIVLIALMVSFSACGGRNSQAGNGSGVTVSAEPMSTMVGETMLMVNLTDSSGVPVTDAEIRVKGDMSHAGMTPVLADPVSFADGAYPVPFEWTMAGDWFLTIDVTLADGTTFTERIDGFEIGEGDGEMEMEMDHSSDE